MNYQGLVRFFSSDIGIDLGTANCLVYVKDKGVVLSEPSVVAVTKDTREVIKVGEDAKKMLGRCPVNIEAVRPMQNGVIADFDITEEMLRYFINKAKRFVSPRRRFVKPRVLVAVPSGITPVERRAVEDSAEHAGAKEVILIDEPMAAAIGVGLPVSDPCGNMIVDIGGGTTEVAVISLSGMVQQMSIRVGGDVLDKTIVEHMLQVYNLVIGVRTAEEIKIQIGSVYPVFEKEKVMEVKGRDRSSGMPKAINVSSEEIRKCLSVPAQSILNAVTQTLEKCPPELASDLIDRGIVLSGGSSLLRGLDKFLQNETQLHVSVADEPLLAVVKGTGIVLQSMDSMA